MHSGRVQSYERTDPRDGRLETVVGPRVLCLSLIVVTIDTTILNVALPSLVRDLRASSSELQWIVDAYTVVFAGLLLIGWSLGDRFGRRGVLAAGLALFARRLGRLGSGHQLQDS